MTRRGYLGLSALTFFQFFALGAYYPLLGTYLKDTLGFSGVAVGTVLSVYQGALMAAPLLAAFVVDRVVSARWLFAGLHLAAAGVALVLMPVTDLVPFLVLFAVYALLIGPTGGLVSALTFAVMPDGQKNYGGIRLWGTVGWVAAAAVLALIWLVPGTTRPLIFALAALGSTSAALLVLALPRRPRVTAQGPVRLFPQEALRIFLKPALLKFGAVFFLSGVLDRFYFIGAAAFLKQLGFSDSQILPAITLGQVTEIFLLLATGPALRRWGLRNTLLVGLGFQFVRFLLLALNPGPLWLLAALSLNGFVFAFFYAVSVIVVDSHTDQANRAGAHQLMNLFFIGFSSLVGAFLTGVALQVLSSGGQVDYRWFWGLPLGASLICLALVARWFSR